MVIFAKVASRYGVGIGLKMIYDELKNYLTLTASIETVKLVDDAVQILDEFGVEEYMDIYSFNFGENTAFGDECIVDNIVAVTDTILTTLLERHSIQLSEIALISDKIYILRGLLRMQNWEDKDTLQLVMDSGETPSEILAELIAVVNSGSVDHVLSLIETFNESLLDRFKEEFLATHHDLLIDPSEIEQQVADYKKVKKATDNLPSKLDRMLDHPGSIGLPFKLYLRVFLLVEYKQYLNEAFTDISARVLAHELILIAALSEEGLSAAVKSVRDNMNEITVDLNIATKIDIAVTQLLLEVNRA